MSDQTETCQVCKLDRYLQPDVKILVSSCFHRICEKCVNRVFRHGSAPCPVCKKVVKKLDLQSQTFEDLFVEKEVRIRKRIQRIFNKRQEDFPTLRQYNDFLEQVEEIIFNLVNEIDVKITEEKVERYKKENQEIIAKNLHKASLEQQAVQSYLELEHQRRIKLREEFTHQLDAEVQAKEVEKESILNELQTSNRSASEILRHYTKQPPSVPSLFSTHTITSSLHVPDPLNLQVIDPFDTLYHDDITESCFDMQDDYYDPYMISFKDNPIMKASGFDIGVTYFRSLEGAFRGLFVQPVSSDIG